MSTREEFVEGELEKTGQIDVGVTNNGQVAIMVPPSLAGGVSCSVEAARGLAVGLLKAAYRAEGKEIPKNAFVRLR